MHKRNLTREKIILVSFCLADEIGINQLNFQKIAEKLDVKYPSLYNHFNNMDELKIEMTVYMLNKMNQKLMHRLIGKSGYDAIREYAGVYKEFAFENKTAYKLFINIPSTKNNELFNLMRKITHIIHEILNSYIKDEILLVHKSRTLRSLLHGFISLYSFGYFQGDVDLEDTFKSMIDDFISSLNK
ncbi:TetR family transcriptional regulator [Clostridium beijerinckii]|uniref:WHG domain-containing protein n=1 Tax=Clostridium beijerinckii TaxID=1520 RepID=A0AB74V9U9_CLOBE|nr:TetR/AcrR family transcriptional regulator [Clostridium beijerinckii]MDG5855344.1 WHG domain-containing protein [Clostridium beijerinckii]NRZ27371.1 AcrR family transcriptional regulator [Clostridium beijerinckii]NYB96838.1 AcrR family transcriptional regulator [Clostridium beijerinckii]OOM22807.1 HTH-type transcriptional repressor FabR [Clostridium beijerinckii]QUN33212.1 WHG domain-containing protein [Clostridium beijerinckii]